MGKGEILPSPLPPQNPLTNCEKIGTGDYTGDAYHPATIHPDQIRGTHRHPSVAECDRL